MYILTARIFAAATNVHGGLKTGSIDIQAAEKPAKTV
jgi:hypothetical protein